MDSLSDTSQKDCIYKEYTDAIKMIKETYYLDPNFHFGPPPNLHISESMSQYSARAQISMDDIDKLNVIHVTGTKGKGSTCTFTESILRHHGYKTGLFVSPHLIETRERMKINGSDLSKELFTKYFWEVHNRLVQTKSAYGGTMPLRFEFFVLLSFHVFIKEGVDVCVLEVGEGGEYDATNMVRATWVCGFTNVYLDHVWMLGNTVEKIAWQKSGIFKPGAIAFVGNVNESTMDVIKSRAAEKRIMLYCIPELSSYESDGKEITLGISGDIQSHNASMALQLARAWLNRRNGIESNILNTKDTTSIIPSCMPFSLTNAMIQGLRTANIMCRCQIVRKIGVTYYIDIAHNPASVKCASKWFFKEANTEENKLKGRCVRILMFNILPFRDAREVLLQLANQQFDAVVFTSTNLYPGADIVDRQEYDFKKNQEMCLKYMKIWHEIHGTSGSEDEIFHCVRDALFWVTQGRDTCVLRKPDDILAPLVEDGDTVKGLESGKLASLRDMAKEIPDYLKNADHIQILVTGDTMLAAAVSKLVSDESGENNRPLLS